MNKIRLIVSVSISGGVIMAYIMGGTEQALSSIKALVYLLVIFFASIHINKVLLIKRENEIKEGTEKDNKN